MGNILREGAGNFGCTVCFSQFLFNMGFWDNIALAICFNSIMCAYNSSIKPKLPNHNLALTYSKIATRVLLNCRGEQNSYTALTNRNGHNNLFTHVLRTP